MHKRSKKAKKPMFVLDCITPDSKLKEYNGLVDSNLAVFFSHLPRKKILIQNKLISPKGFIITKKVFKRNKSPKSFDPSDHKHILKRHKSSSPKNQIVKHRKAISQEFCRSSSFESKKEIGELSEKCEPFPNRLSTPNAKLQIPRLQITTEGNFL
ncbi:unnamed protein product [Blepharisma stoltei]|uniref:Uncharacterized protein n=1 Tax=Blepharisma stoltei TaxID=1481888 RepID=A0AAU9JC56_9CILI|nr:unnamed protein product [Blepharisma stoltei]